MAKSGPKRPKTAKNGPTRHLGDRGPGPCRLVAHRGRTGRSSGTLATRRAPSTACLGPFWVVLGRRAAPPTGPASKAKNGRTAAQTSRIGIPRALLWGATPRFGWFPPLVLSCLGSLSTQLTLVLAYTLPNAHVGHLKMSEDFA